MQNKKIYMGVVICLVVAGLSFWGGMIYAGKNITAANASRQGGFNQNGFNQNGGGTRQVSRGGANAGGLVSGEVLSVDSKSITVKLRDGGSKIVLFSPTTKVEKTVDGVTTDVVVGKQVSITGTANTDGSVSATSIQVRPLIAMPQAPQAKTN
jgi:hypothetical protein